MALTKRNHYNPCFWTALWNPEYYESFVNDLPNDLVPREQLTNVLSVKSNKVYKDKVDNVHYEKKMGIAQITFDDAKEFCRRYKPQEYDDFLRESADDPYPILWDFENILTTLEGTPSYQVLPQIIKRQNIASAEEKVYLADFIFLHRMRNHAIMNSIIEWNEKQGIKKFEYFALLKWMLSDPRYSLSIVSNIASSLWTLYRTEKDTFPLTDSPVLMKDKNIMVALSPRLLLEISGEILVGEKVWLVKDSLETKKFTEFKRRTINNTFREIIFQTKKCLQVGKRPLNLEKGLKSFKK